MSQRVKGKGNKLKIYVQPKHFYLHNDNGELEDFYANFGTVIQTNKLIWEQGSK